MWVACVILHNECVFWQVIVKSCAKGQSEKLVILSNYSTGVVLPAVISGQGSLASWGGQGFCSAAWRLGINRQRMNIAFEQAVQSPIYHSVPRNH